MPSARHRRRSSSSGLLPRRPPLEQADEDGPGPVDVGDGGVGREADAAVGPDGREPVGQVLHRRPQGEQVEVVVGDHDDHGLGLIGGSSPRTACRRRPTSSTTGSRWCGGSPTRSSRRGRARRDGRWRRWRRRPGPAAAVRRRPCPPRPRADATPAARLPWRRRRPVAWRARRAAIIGSRWPAKQPFDQVIEVVDELGAGVDEQRRRPAAGQADAGAGRRRVGGGAGHDPRGQGRPRHPVGVRLPPERGQHLGVVAAPPGGRRLDLRRQPVRVGGQVGAQQVAVARRPDPPPQVRNELGDRRPARFLRGFVRRRYEFAAENPAGDGSMRAKRASRSSDDSRASAMRSKRAVRAAAKDIPDGTQAGDAHRSTADRKPSDSNRPWRVVARKRPSCQPRTAPSSPTIQGSTSTRHPAVVDAVPVDPLAVGHPARAVEHLVRPELRAQRAANPSPSTDPGGPSAPSGSAIVVPIICAPAHTATTGAPHASTAAARPDERNQSRSPRVFFDPGSTTRSGRPRADADRTQRTATPGSSRKGSRSPKLAIRGKRTTATSTTAPVAGTDGVPRVERQRVLGVDVGAGHGRDHAQHRHARPPLQLGAGVAQQRRVAPEAVDDEPPHARPQVVGQQGPRPEQRGEHAAPLDVAHDHRRQPGRRRQRHVGEVARQQVDLGRPAGPLADHHVVPRPQVVQRGQHRRPQRRLDPVVLGRRLLARRRRPSPPPGSSARRWA